MVFGRDETLGIYIWIVENQNEKILPIVPLNNKSLSLGTWIEFEDDELRNYKVIDHLFETIVKGERLQARICLSRVYKNKD